MHCTAVPIEFHPGGGGILTSMGAGPDACNHAARVDVMQVYVCVYIV